MIRRTLALWSLSLAFVSAYPAEASETEKDRTISVSGAAEIKVVPDEVVITFGVETWDEALPKAKADNDALVKKLFQVVRKFGVADKQVQTDYIGIEPTYKDRSYNQGRYVVSGYFVRKSVVVTLKETEKFEPLLSSAVEGGVTHIHNVEFRTTQLRKYRDQARGLAIKAAEEKARNLAKELNVTAGKPLTVNEWSSWEYYGGGWRGGWRGSQTAQNVVQAAPSGSGLDTGETVALGQIGVKASVNVTFELK